MAIKSEKHQLKKYFKNEDGSEEIRNIYPITLLSNVIDEYTGKRLSEVMFLTNHLWLRKEESFACTMSRVPKGFRRLGLYVTVVDDINKEFVTYVYIGKNAITCCELKKEENWRKIRTSNEVEEKSKLEEKVKALEEKVKSLIGVRIMTQAELEELEERDENTLYYIKDL
jgi:hypothetical protein